MPAKLASTLFGQYGCLYSTHAAPSYPAELEIKAALAALLMSQRPPSSLMSAKRNTLKDADLTVRRPFQTRVRILSTVNAPELRMPGPPPQCDLGRDPDYRLIDTWHLKADGVK